MLWAECQPGDTGGNLWAEQEVDGDEGAEVGDHGQGGDGEEGWRGAGGGYYQADEGLCQDRPAAGFAF